MGCKENQQLISGYGTPYLLPKDVIKALILFTQLRILSSPVAAFGHLISSTQHLGVS
jgi:hypothetical protein